MPAPNKPQPQSKKPEWLDWARGHATEYLTRFAFNPGVEKIVEEFDPGYLAITDMSKRLDRLKALAAEHWDFRKGRERFEITEEQPFDAPGSELGKIIFEGSSYAEMSSRSKATLKHYDIVAILGGANMAPYNRLRYALEQPITYDMLAYLGSERVLKDPEREIVKGYAPGAKNEFDLGKGAIVSLMGDQLDDLGEYELNTSEWQIAHLQKKDETPIFILSAPPYLGGARANTADTYDFLRRLEQEGFMKRRSLLFVTSAHFRYAQYFDAVREITLTTGVDIETIGFDAAYTGIPLKASQMLQEIKAAADAAVRLRDAVANKDAVAVWRAQYYNRFERKEQNES
jgi:hypothetical protein